MKNWLKISALVKLLTVLGICAIANQTQAAGLMRTMYQGVRPMGMGNAFLAIADDQNALFYNPAGLAHIKGAHVNLFDFVQAADSLDTFKRTWSAMKNGNYNNLIRQDTEFLRLQIKPSFITRYFGFAIYNNLSGFFDFQNLAAAEVDVYALNDFGLITGFGVPIGPYISLGASLKAIHRSAIDAYVTPQTLLEELGTTTTDFQNAAFTYLQRQIGTGYGFGADLGFMAKFPISAKKLPEVRVGATVENVAQLDFRRLGSANIPRPVPMTYNLGGALVYESGKNATLTLAADLRNNFENLPLLKQAHLGLEYRNPYFGARFGIHQGYPTGGLSLETPPHTRIHFTTYSVELGDRLWSRQLRVYLLQFVVGFNPI